MYIIHEHFEYYIAFAAGKFAEKMKYFLNLVYR
jgi:hypothetical protein